MERRTQRARRVDGVVTHETALRENPEHDPQDGVARRAVLRVAGRGRPERGRIASRMSRSEGAVGVRQGPDLPASVPATGRARERRGHGIAQLAEGEDGDAATQGVEPADVLVEARDGDPEARGEARERQLVVADLVGTVGSSRDDDGRGQAGPRHGSHHCRGTRGWRGSRPPGTRRAGSGPPRGP